MVLFLRNAQFAIDPSSQARSNARTLANSHTVVFVRSVFLPFDRKDISPERWAFIAKIFRKRFQK